MNRLSGPKSVERLPHLSGQRLERIRKIRRVHQADGVPFVDVKAPGSADNIQTGFAPLQQIAQVPERRLMQRQGLGRQQYRDNLE